MAREVTTMPCCRACRTGPGPGQTVHDAEITIAASVSCSRCTRTPRQLRERQDQQVRPLVRDLQDAGGARGRRDSRDGTLC